MKKWLEKHRIWWHSHDHRFWINLKNAVLNFEWYFLRRARGFTAMINLNNGDGDRITLSVGLPRLFRFYISLETRHLRPIMSEEWRDSSLRPGEKFWMPIERDIGIRIFNGTIWFSIWDNPMEWSRSDPWWWRFNFNPTDFLFGRSKIIEEVTTAKNQFSIQMPESTYNGSLRLYRVRYKRSRWPFFKTYNQHEIEMDDPIPIPGKGENSWDIDDDAIYGISGSAKTEEEALARLLGSVNRSRIRYGGPEWLPVH